jgi:hypothetical protein
MSHRFSLQILKSVSPLLMGCCLFNDAQGAGNRHRVAYYKNGEIHVNILGTPEVKPITQGHWDFKPSWSKTGDKLVFFRRLVNAKEVSNWKTAICIINVDGSEFHQLTDGAHTDFNQTWTRDGSNTPIWSRRTPDTQRYRVFASKIRAKPGEEIALTPEEFNTWAFSCLKDGRILVRANPPKQGPGYYLMSPNLEGTPKYERIQCELDKGGILARISLSVDEKRVCFEYQKGFKKTIPSRILYLADFNVSKPAMTNFKPFANEAGEKIWFAYPRWTRDQSAIVCHAGRKLFLYTPDKGTTKQVSPNNQADYRYPHGEATPK